MEAAFNPASRLRGGRTLLSPLARQYAVMLPLILAALDGIGGTVNAMPTQPWTTSLHSISRIFFSDLLCLVIPAGLVIGAAFHYSPRGGWPRVAIHVLAVIVASLLGIVLMYMYTYGEAWSPRHWREDVSIGVGVLPFTSLLTVAYELHRRSLDTEAEFQRDSVARAQLGTERDRARLQTLRAQIEPHFLFNTLANVRRLYQLDRSAGADMLDNLLRYFESALPKMRDDECSLADEIQLIESYLNIQRIRMGHRLAFQFNIAEALAGERVPTMMLLTLIENSIKHGLDPLPEGGFVQISAQRLDGVLELRVSDTGRGIVAGTGSGTGTGLANIRARLAALHGARASLSLSLNQPRGVTARIRLPVTG